MDRCRICLEFKKNLSSVFEEDREISYAEMLTSVANVKIVEDTDQNSICLQCRKKLKCLYYFKKEIERSDLEIKRHLKILRFDNIDQVKAQLMDEIENKKNNWTCDSDAKLSGLWEDDCQSIFYGDTTISKNEFFKNHIDENKAMCDSDFEVEDLYDDLVLSDYKSIRKKKVKQSKERGRDVKKTVKYSSNMKKLCIKPIVLENIRIIPSKRRPNKMHKEHKHRKRLDMCPHCGKMSSNMKSHIMVHIGERNYKCPDCSKSFFTSNLLRYHRRKHLTTGAFKCDHCVAVFNTKTSLLSHMVSHTEDKNHVCPICNKGFKRKSSLLRHKLIHNSTAKSVKCDLCNMSFLYKQGLRHHMRVHTGERPFRCDICSQPYSYKHDFNRHCLKKHGVFLKQRTVHVMNEEVLMQERALMKDLMLRVQGVVKEGEPLNPFHGPYAALAFDEAVKALGSCQIPIDVML